MARIRKPHVFVDGKELKKCPKCEELNELALFAKDKSRRDGLYPHCRSCDAKRHDPAVYVPRNKEWRENHKDHTRVYKREYLAKRRSEDPLFKIKELLRSRLRNALQGKKKTERAMELVGCSLEELKIHLETTFQDGMTWENQGSGWHIDHKIPCVAFDLEDPLEQRACFHYKNLQALWKLENSAKGGTYTREAKEAYMRDLLNR